MARIDVTVMGAGIFGLACAWACAARGARVRVIDPKGVAAGASGGVVGALAPHAPERWTPLKAFQFDCLIAGEGFWAEVEAVSGLSAGYARLGRMQPLADDAAVARAQERAEAAAALWQGKARWQVVKAPERAGWAPVSPTGLVVFDDLSARLSPARACASLAAAITALGGEVATEGAREGAVIWATGAAGLAMLSQALGRSVGAGVKGQAAVLGHDARDHAQIAAPGLHIVPHADGTVAVGSTSERDFADPTATDERLDAVIARARALVPALRDAPVIRRWAGVRPRARSRMPMLGPWPGRPGEFVANGGFKIGFALAPGVGRLMADLVLEGHDAIAAEFRVEANL
ncbi:Glycine/D-amino acid oxidase [Meinhardsimonia xiamenensis]|uniref:Glycine/D-amino acid oxidase n=1 Tax=Meinhardsimonia xiamenensis TaxID=990712 RepID=A0A1G8YCQ1_9RHOB|nr:FAD-dependent oxidoreductase [Meinhardsimonia xiamenensis]PRX37249.1 glycine/D-amino acid oxidase-like deaminating enzyme [Meinhardsimonia xiamenensis]SDK00453.1 Glycine/D-amino acid oxidase [Meinhardsimonia xiamenensis]